MLRSPDVQVSRVIVCDPNTSALTIPITINTKDKSIETTALIDCGAEGTFIHKELVKQHQLPTYALNRPIIARNVDNTINKEGVITRYTKLNLGLNTTDERLLITNTGKSPIILGLPWLKQVNPQIDWANGSIELPEHILRSLAISKVTFATTLAQNVKDNKPHTIPPEYRDFRDVFDKAQTNQLPPSRSYDHAIELKSDFVPKNCKVYPLTLKEEETLDIFLQENLEKGFIRPSTSPQASPFFFVGKKDGTLRPIQDYRLLNKATIKNTYLLPLVSDLLDQIKGYKFFTKLDL